MGIRLHPLQANGAFNDDTCGANVAHGIVDSVSRDFKREVDLAPAPLVGEIGDAFDDESLVGKTALE